MKDLYAILGLTKEATQEDIKKAYYKLSMKHHPDKGGDIKEFQEINLANEILSEPETRQKYDRGEPVFNVQDPEVFIRNRAIQIFAALVEGGQLDFDHVDVFKHIIGNIQAQIAQVPNMKSNATGAINKMEKIKKRIGGKNGPIFISLLDEKIKQAQTMSDSLDREVPIMEAMVKFLEDAEYIVDELKPMTITFGSGAYGGSGSTYTGF